MKWDCQQCAPAGQALSLRSQNNRLPFTERSLNRCHWGHMKPTTVRARRSGHQGQQCQRPKALLQMLGEQAGLKSWNRKNASRAQVARGPRIGPLGHWVMGGERGRGSWGCWVTTFFSRPPHPRAGAPIYRGQPGPHRSVRTNKSPPQVVVPGCQVSRPDNPRPHRHSPCCRGCLRTLAPVPDAWPLRRRSRRGRKAGRRGVAQESRGLGACC
ncbi:hypothetical protein HJG60_011043 [Phyllostomus discolor]|uniref:Uncharacterized protein n=1 Tax=Phyllostomus discolor TaxID=89673 RepID=A0A834ECZ8_9CHIR|nr:hypothetical protein HJG60_011043 [Phyllostomus discolor]